MRPFIRLALLLLLAPAAAAAQRAPAIITGQVMVRDSAPFAGQVLVRVESRNTGASTDSAGRYRLVIPAARFTDGDSVELLASRTGLAPRSQRIALVAGQEVAVNFRLRRRHFDICDECLVWISPFGTEPRPGYEYRKLCRITEWRAKTRDLTASRS